MKIVEKLSPKRFLRRRSKKERTSVSRSDSSSFSSDSYRRKPGSGPDRAGTTTSVSPEISGDWSDLHYDLVRALKLLDRDNDGVILRSELESLLIRLGPEPPTEEEMSLMVSEVDREGDGCITIEALMSRVGNSACEPAGEPELKETFDFFDTEHDGKITAEELLQVLTSLGDGGCTLDDCRCMIALVDKNEDGFVCFEDFSRMMELHR